MTHRWSAPNTARLATILVGISICGGGAGCEEGPGPRPLTFPETFLLGGATAGFQVDMGCPTLAPEICDDRGSDWYVFVTDASMIAEPGNHLVGEDPAVVGPGHFELYETDYDLAAADGHNAFRMSLEWSRIFPRSTVGIEGAEALAAVADATQVAHYHAMFTALRQRGLTPLVTIHHYTLPLWIHDPIGCHYDLESCAPRGWLDRERTVREIAKYAGFVAREFGQYVDLWATQNEPLAVVLPGYVMRTGFRTQPPSVMYRSEEAHTVFGAMVEAHARMVDAVRAADTVDADGDGEAAQVGLVYALAPVYAADPEEPLDVQAAQNTDYLWNLAFLDGAALGALDENLDGTPIYREDLDGRLDWLGINYKQVVVVEGLAGSALPGLSPLLTLDPLTLDMSQIRPEGLYQTIARVAERYGVPMIITENNGQNVPEGNMDLEIRYVVENLSWIALALRDGYDVRGYFYWAMMDNYEWNHGMQRPLGLYAVDPADPAKIRVPREMAPVFARIAEAHQIPEDLRSRYPIEAQ